MEIFGIKFTYLKQIIISVLLIFIGAIVYKLLKKFIKKVMLKNSNNIPLNKSQKIKTIYMLIINILKYLIVIIVTLTILAMFGVNVSSLVAGVGITTAIIGLAFQDLAKDLIAGVFIITESQYEIGDVIEVDGFKGEVISLGLKTTKIKDYKGAVKIIGNHYMDNMINYSLKNSLAIVDVGIDYEYKPEEIEKVLNKLVNKLKNKIPYVTGELEVLGITSLGDSAVNYRLTVETESNKQYEVERFIRKELKDLLDKENIKIPFPQIEVHNGK